MLAALPQLVLRTSISLQKISGDTNGQMLSTAYGAAAIAVAAAAVILLSSVFCPYHLRNPYYTHVFTSVTATLAVSGWTLSESICLATLIESERGFCNSLCHAYSSMKGDDREVLTKHA
jgi:hypothetical protein